MFFQKPAQRGVFFLMFLRYCCLNDGCFYHPPSVCRKQKGENSVRNQINIQPSLKLYEKCFAYKVRRF